MLSPVTDHDHLAVFSIRIAQYNQVLVVRDQQCRHGFIAQQLQWDDINQGATTHELRRGGFEEFSFQPALIPEPVVVVWGVQEKQRDRLVRQRTGLPGCTQDAVHILFSDLRTSGGELNTPTRTVQGLCQQPCRRTFACAWVEQASVIGRRKPGLQSIDYSY